MRPVAPPSGRAAISSNAVRAQPVAAAANEAMSGKVRSGRAAAGGVAPAPGRSWRRSIQTVVSPSALAGTWSWYRLWATCRIRSRGRPRRSNSDLEVVRVRLVAAALLRGHDPVEVDAEPAVRGREQVVVAVREHAEAEARLEHGERGRGVVERGPVHRPSRRTPAIASSLGSSPCGVATPRRADREDLAVAAVRPAARRRPRSPRTSRGARRCRSRRRAARAAGAGRSPGPPPSR